MGKSLSGEEVALKLYLEDTGGEGTGGRSGLGERLGQRSSCLPIRLRGYTVQDCITAPNSWTEGQRGATGQGHPPPDLTTGDLPRWLEKSREPGRNCIWANRSQKIKQTTKKVLNCDVLPPSPKSGDHLVRCY